MGAPLRAILCLFDGQPVRFSIGGLESGNVTYGHRFMAPEAITISDPHDYVGALDEAHVLVDAGARSDDCRKRHCIGGECRLRFG